jgi:succinate dehydrogenase / fumarate reductase membrane anchor subunit
VSRQTALGRVLGLGSAKEGTDHFYSQRISALAVAGLGLWFVVALGGLIADGFVYRDVAAWLASPLRATALVALLVALSYHSSLGVQVVIEDYLHGAAKVVALIAQRFVHFGAALAGSIAVLRAAFGS